MFEERREMEIRKKDYGKERERHSQRKGKDKGIDTRLSGWLSKLTLRFIHWVTQVKSSRSPCTHFLSLAYTFLSLTHIHLLRKACQERLEKKGDGKWILERLTGKNNTVTDKPYCVQLHSQRFSTSLRIGLACR